VEVDVLGDWLAGPDGVFHGREMRFDRGDRGDVM
jgi:hypothetical protein